jgi:hypothetical protein
MAIPSEVFSAALAHGLTINAINTWNPNIARSPRVLVPIEVTALAVRAAGGTWADCKMSAPPPDADETNLAAAVDLLPPPFQNLDKPRAVGVYLHWALPDALTRGTVSATDPNASFPAVPDRWLIVRLSAGRTPSRRAVRGWVLEADGPTPKVTDLQIWTEPINPDAPPPLDVRKSLTAVGHGDPFWSAYFDNVENRLGFHDQFLDGVLGPLAYLVCGWHSRHADDLIGEGLRTYSQFEARLQQLGWEIPSADLEAAFQSSNNTIQGAALSGVDTREARFAAATQSPLLPVLNASFFTQQIASFQGVAGAQTAAVDKFGAAEAGSYLVHQASWPQFTLYHGAIVGMGWPGPGIGVAPDGLMGGEVGGPPPAESIKTSIGNTAAEALAAMLADNNGNEQESRLLEAVLLDAMQDLDQPDGAARIDVRLHAKGFGSLPGGSDTKTIPQRQSVTAQPHIPDPTQTDPGVFASLQPKKQSVTNVLGGKEQVLGVVNASSNRPVSKIAPPQVLAGGMASAIDWAATRNIIAQRPTIPAVDPDPASVETEVQRTKPRFFVPPDPVILLQGARRSFKHGSDSLYSESGDLPCRLTGSTVTSLRPKAAANLPNAGAVTGADLLESGVGNGSVPPECEALLEEMVLLDPGSADAAVQAATRGTTAVAASVASQLARTYAVEQMMTFINRDPRRDIAPLTAISGFTGTLPPGASVAAPISPWIPLHIDWDVDCIPSPGGADDWILNEVDFDADPERLPPVEGTVRVQNYKGRALLTGGVARMAAAAVRQSLDRAQRSGGSVSLQPGFNWAFNSKLAQTLLAAIQPLRAAASPAAVSSSSDFNHLVTELEGLDVLAGAFDRFHTKLRSGFIADGTAAPKPGDPVPPDFVPFRAGFLRIHRMRLVDCYGQIVDLVGSGATQSADMTRIIKSEPLTVAGRTDLIELAPRFTAPLRSWFRFMSAADDTVEADDDVSALCGFIMPNHLDGDLQFFGPNGTGLGAVLPRPEAGIVWEDAPGRPSTVGGAPLRAIDNAHLGGIAQGLVDWGRADAVPNDVRPDTALSSILRIIDSTLWSVDPFGHVGDEHLALLVGHPVAVLRAKLRLELEEPVAPAVASAIRVPVRIGALAHWQDGLLAYFVNDDYRTLCIPDPACANFARPVGAGAGFLQQATDTSDYYQHFADDLGAGAVKGNTPVNHPYVDLTGLVHLQPGQDLLLTLLVEPHSSIHLTTGLLPRKDIGMRRNWVAPGLALLAPVFRFGPVMVDPKRIRMPVASDIQGSWSWSHRIDATTWADEPVVNSGGDAQIPADPSKGQEGWLKLSPVPPSNSSG